MTTETTNDLINASAARLTAQRMALYISGLTFTVVLFLAGITLNLNGDVKVIEYRLNTLDKKLDVLTHKIDILIKRQTEK